VLMLVLGLAAMGTVDTQTRVSGGERVRESSFNLTEAVLNAQTFVLGRLGTGTAGAPFPAQCPAVPASALCPDVQAIARSYDAASHPDYGPSLPSWTTTVRDNTGGTFYDPSTAAGAPRYDANGDKQLWVRSTAVVRGKTRSLVALIRVEDRPVAFPRYSITAGFFRTTNQGNKVIVDASGSLGVGVRCYLPPSSPSCLGYSTSKGQLSPAGSYTLGYSSDPAISADDLQALEDNAKASGTYYTGCPSDPNGAVVVVESGDCTYNNSAPAAAGAARCCNTPGSPGVLIIKSGTLKLLGSISFEGLIYMPNQQRSSGTLVTTGGTALVRGGVVIDGGGGLEAGSSGLNVQFSVAAFEKVHSIGTAGIVQNTWREIIG
ncbi:MAG: hypothetical protein ABR549_07340, partial [Mycobacteriales bacterium]